MVDAALGARLAALTGRQRQVYALWATGLSRQAVATQLCIAERTVEAHLDAVRTQLSAPQGAAGGRWLSYVLGALDAAQHTAGGAV